MARHPIDSSPTGARAPRAKVRQDAAPVVERADGWKNVLTGMGVPGRDWRQSTEQIAGALMTREEIDDLYQEEWLAARIVDLIPEHCTRRWVRFSAEGNGIDDDIGRAVLDSLEELDAPAKFTEWMRLGRKDGGSVMLLGADDGSKDLSLPLDLTRVTELRHLHVLERWPWIPGDLDTDPMSPTFGQHLFYDLNPSAAVLSAGSSGVLGASTLPRARQGTSTTWSALRNGPGSGTIRVHASRLIVHPGIRISERLRVRNLGWGLSVLQRPRDVIQGHGELWGHIRGAFKHMSQSVLRLKGLRELIAQDQEQKLAARLSVIQLFRSMYNLIPIDSEDEGLEEVATRLDGAAEMLARDLDELAGAAEMPLTLLFGHSPSGFSSDDEPGMRNFYDSVANKQRRELLKPLNRVVELLLSSRAGPTGGVLPERWQVEWVPLVEPTEAEAATTELAQASADEKYITNGVLDPDEVRNGLRNRPHSRYVITDDAAEDLAPDPAEVAALANAQAGRAPGDPAPSVDDPKTEEKPTP